MIKYIQTIDKLMKTFPDVGVIKNTPALLPKIFNLFTAPHGHISYIINYYLCFLDGELSKDMSMNLLWLIENDKEYKPIWSNIRTLRNTGAHSRDMKYETLKTFARNIIYISKFDIFEDSVLKEIMKKTIKIFRLLSPKKLDTYDEIELSIDKMYVKIEDLADNPHSYRWFMIHVGPENLENVLFHVLDGKYLNKKIFLKSSLFGDVTDINGNEISINLETNLRFLTECEDNIVTESLRWFKEHGYMDTLKGKKIIIERGRRKNKCATFISWSEATALLYIEEENILTSSSLDLIVTVTSDIIIYNDEEASSKLDIIYDSIDFNKNVDISFPLEQKTNLKVLSENEDIVITESIKWFKEEGYKEILKRRKIIIANGLRKDKSGIFINWSGTTATIYVDDEDKRIFLPLKTIITISV